MKKILSVVLVLTISASALAQKGADTVVVELAKTSRMVFTIKDKSDLEQLRQYDFQAMFDDILAKLERNDSVIVVVNPANEKTSDVIENPESGADQDITIYHHDEDENDWDEDDDRQDRLRRHRTTHSFNLDMGLSNYLENGKFPDEAGAAYAVRPWGSWYFGLSSVQRTRLDEKFYLEWALGVSWYDFKFQKDNTVVVKGDSEISYEEDVNDVTFVKSRMQITYLHMSAVPMFSFGGYPSSKKWRNYNTGFRIGAGPYAAYRVGSSTKQVFKEDGDKDKIKNNDNFYLNNIRYGVRVQVGFKSADFFFNYDLNELFATDKGPKLNAFSFGITF